MILKEIHTLRIDGDQLLIWHDSCEWVDNIPQPVQLDGQRKEKFLEIYRNYVNQRKDPEDRYISGVDDVEFGVFSTLKRQQAIKSALTLRESKTHISHAPEVLDYLVSVTFFSDKVTKSRDETIEMFGKIQSKTPVMLKSVGDYPDAKIELLSTMYKTMTKYINAEKEFNDSLSELLNGWIKD